MLIEELALSKNIASRLRKAAQQRCMTQRHIAALMGSYQHRSVVVRVMNPRLGKAISLSVPTASRSDWKRFRRLAATTMS
jgi:hypothetical protein